MDTLYYSTIPGGLILGKEFILKIKKPWKVVKTLLISGKVYVVVEHEFLESPGSKSTFPEEEVKFLIVKDNEDLKGGGNGFSYINSHYLSTGSGQPHEFHMETYHILLQH